MFCQRLSAPGGESCRWQMCAERVVAVLLVPKFTTPFAAHQAGGQKKWPTLCGGCASEREDWGWGGGEGTVTTVFTCPGQHDGQPQQPLLLSGCPQPLQVYSLTWTSPVFALTPELNWHYIFSDSGAALRQRTLRIYLRSSEKFWKVFFCL